MKIEDYLEQISETEMELGKIIDTKFRMSNVSEGQAIVVAMMNDTVDLIEDLSRDIYMFELSYENYNNGLSFNPNYYMENMLLHDDMLWERIVCLVGINYNLDLSQLFEKKTIEVLYKSLKKEKMIDNEIKETLCQIRADFNMRALKFDRSNNEHFISINLSNKQEYDNIKVDYTQFVNEEDDFFVFNLEKFLNVTFDYNFEVVKIIKNNIPIIKKKQKLYIDVMKRILNIMNICDEEYSFSCQSNMWAQKMVQCDRNFVCESYELEKKYEILREKYRDVINKHNQYFVDCGDNSAYIRNTLLIDVIFRVKEISRTINLYLTSLNKLLNPGKKAYKCTDDDFKKFCCNELIGPNYYAFHASIKMYSIYEKLAKFILCKYDIDKEYTKEENFKNLYYDKIQDILKKKKYRTDCIDLFDKCISSTCFKNYEMMRNKEYHCLRQEYLNPEKSGEFVLGKVYLVYLLLEEVYPLIENIIYDEEIIIDKRIQDRKDKIVVVK